MQEKMPCNMGCNMELAGGGVGGEGCGGVGCIKLSSRVCVLLPHTPSQSLSGSRKLKNKHIFHVCCRQFG